MEKFKFFEVDKNYISYLQKGESKIPNISYSTNDKFICGILFSIDDKKYYAPISSFNKQQKTNILIKNNTGRVTSSIRLSFMFPVPNSAISMKDFSKENPSYKRLLMEELDYCNKHADKIIEKALYIYDSVIQGKDVMMQKNCCNFINLEKLYSIYCEQKKELTHNVTATEDKLMLTSQPQNNFTPHKKPSIHDRIEAAKTDIAKEAKEQPPARPTHDTKPHR